MPMKEHIFSFLAIIYVYEHADVEVKLEAGAES